VTNGHPHSQPDASNGRCGHIERLATAQEDLDAAESLNLAVADRATLALAFERMRGGLADVIRMEREHHPGA
jgi:hypothetical protein